MGPTQETMARWTAEPAARATLLEAFRLFDRNGIEIVIPNKRARAILSMLCLTIGEPIDRETLSKLLWPGRFPAHARASLRQCLLELGKLLAPLGPDVLVITRNSVAIRPGAIQTDLDEAQPAGKRILAQLDFGEPFNSWLAARRLEIEGRLATGLDIPVGAAAPPSTGNKSGVAVLPFRTASEPGGQGYFADGMVDELITALGRVPQLLVAGRTSSFHFRDSKLPSAQIAAELGVNHLVEGSVQRQGEQVRIHVHLISGETGFELWGDRFDGDLDGIFALQEAVAQAVTNALATAIGIALQPPVMSGMTRSKEAYDLYLQGRALCVRVMGDGVLDKGIGLLEQAVAHDPDFVEGWIAVAEAHQMVAVYTQCPDRPAAVGRMADCAHRAMALSPASGYPVALLGIERWIAGDIVGALDHAYRAYRLEPANPAVTMRLASLLIYCGRVEDAAPFVQAAIEQDPIDGRKHALVWAVDMARGNFDAAAQAGQRMVDLAFPSIYLAIANMALGKHDLAVEQYKLTKRLVNTVIMAPAGTGTMSDEAMDSYWQIAANGVCSGKQADREAYRQVLDFMFATLPDKGDLAIAAPAIFTGHAELAFKALGDHASPANMLAYVNLWTKAEPICRVWQDDEFIPFAQRIGMAAAWDKYGWPDLLPPPDNRI